MSRTVKLVVTGLVLALVVAGAMMFFDLDDWRILRGSPEVPPPLAGTEAEKKVLAVMDEMLKTGKTFRSVEEEDGRMLRLLTEAVGARHVVEIGTSTGYSGLWFCLALQKTGGRLTTFEIDPERAALAREHFKKAGVDHLVTVVEGDAHENMARIEDAIDVAFIDAEKEGYRSYLEELLPHVRPGGLILAEDLSMVPEYVRAVTTRSGLETLFYTGGEGLGITLKKR